VLQIPAVELEDLLLAHPLVKDAAVFGIPHSEDGYHPTAFVVASLAVSENHLLEYVAGMTILFHYNYLLINNYHVQTD
jgi:fatty acid CoA ligase FadD36